MKKIVYCAAKTVKKLDKESIGLIIAFTHDNFGWAKANNIKIMSSYYSVEPGDKEDRLTDINNVIKAINDSPDDKTVVIHCQYGKYRSATLAVCIGDKLNLPVEKATYDDEINKLEMIEVNKDNVNINIEYLSDFIAAHVK